MNVNNDYQNSGYGSAQGGFGVAGAYGPAGLGYGAYGDPVTGALAALTHANSTDLIRDVAENKLAVVQTSSDLATGTVETGRDISMQIRDLEKELHRTHVQLKDQIIGVNFEINREFRGLDNRICNFEKDATKNFYENKVKLLEVACDLNKEIATSRYLVDKQIMTTEASLSQKIFNSEVLLTRELTNNKFAVERQLDGLSKQIENCCCDMKQMNLQSKIDSTQDELNELRHNSSTAAIIAALKHRR